MSDNTGYRSWDTAKADNGQDMKRVLIVDDDSFFANMVSRMFSQRGWRSILCFSMEDALRVYDPRHVHLIVTDIFMPGMGGLEGIQILRKTFPDVAIIAMSGGWEGMPSQDTIDAAVKIGADTGLQKPIVAEALDRAIDALNLA